MPVRAEQMGPISRTSRTYIRVSDEGCDFPDSDFSIRFRISELVFRVSDSEFESIWREESRISGFRSRDSGFGLGFGVQGWNSEVQGLAGGEQTGPISRTSGTYIQISD